MKNEIRKFVSGKIREFRIRADLTQKELGDLVGVKHNTISSYEKGTNEPEQNILFSLAKVFGVSINDFFPSNGLSESTHIYYPVDISAGEPHLAEAITEYEAKEVNIPNSMMGKWASHDDVYVTKVNGESMNNVIPDKSLIAVKPVDVHNLKNGDIVIFSHDGEYGVKRFYQFDDVLVFRPDSNNVEFSETKININDVDNLEIHGKVVLYIVELD